MAAFTALQRRGIPSKFLYFPDENHWVLKPQNSVFWHETVLGWLDQWTKYTGGEGGLGSEAAKQNATGNGTRHGATSGERARCCFAASVVRRL